MPARPAASVKETADASEFITKLPKAEHEAAEWQSAMEALVLLATHGGPTMFARIGVMRALNRHVERVFNPDRKDPIGESRSQHGIDDRPRTVRNQPSLEVPLLERGPITLTEPDALDCKIGDLKEWQRVAWHRIVDPTITPFERREIRNHIKESNGELRRCLVMMSDRLRFQARKVEDVGSGFTDLEFRLFVKGKRYRAIYPGRGTPVCVVAAAEPRRWSRDAQRYIVVRFATEQRTSSDRPNWSVPC